MRKMFLVACTMFMPFSAFADDAKPVPPAEQTMTITLSVLQWQKIVLSVARSDSLSARDASDIINTIQSQMVSPAKQGTKK